MTDCIAKEITPADRAKRSRARLDRNMNQFVSTRVITTERHNRRVVKGELRRDYGYEVKRVVEYDETGMVYTIPHQVEIDIIVKKDKFVILEIRQIATSGDTYVLAKKAELYEKKHNKKPTALATISIMRSPRSKGLMEAYGILHFSFTSEFGAALSQILE